MMLYFVEKKRKHYSENVTIARIERKTLVILTSDSLTPTAEPRGLA